MAYAKLNLITASQFEPPRDEQVGLGPWRVTLPGSVRIQADWQVFLAHVGQIWIYGCNSIYQRIQTSGHLVSLPSKKKHC
jgi:hypothetical protein